MQELRALDKKIRSFSQIGAILGWDQETYLPDGAVSDRAQQLAVLETHLHSLITNPDLSRFLSALEESPPPSLIDQALVKSLRRDHDRAIKIPGDLVERRARHVSESQAAWAKARRENDFPAFEPYLETMVDITREVTRCLGWKDHPYDALLDEYEPFITTQEVKEVFDKLQPRLSELVKTIAAHPPINSEVLSRSYPKEKQEALGKDILGKMGFDWNRGRLDVSTHPFCTTLGDDDIRLTTRYDENFFNMAVYGMIHEAGHGLYEQGIGTEIRGTSLAKGTSMGIHESQSRFWENIVGRSLGFVNHFFPALHQYFPQALEGVSSQEFYSALNKVEPSFIRVEADEVTYSLHIILRFRLELALIEGSLQVKDLPDAWNQGFQELFGIRPPTNAEGCLQDVHWSMGGIGYFPTYALGNLYAAQWRHYIKKDMDLETLVSQGNFAPILQWLRDKIHRHGSVYSARDLCVLVTGEPLNPEYFLQYIQEKYGSLYGF